MANRIRLRCYVCNALHGRQQMVRIGAVHLQNQEIREIAITRRDLQEREPLAIDDNTRLCFNCYHAINRDIDLVRNNPMSVRLNVLKQTRNNSCFICNEVHDIHRLSIECKVEAFVLCDIFFPETVRSCRIHLDDRGFILEPLLANVNFLNRNIIIPGQYLKIFMQGLRNNSLSSRRRFNDVTDFTDEECNNFTSLTKEQFNDLYQYFEEREGARQNITRKDLLMFLCKLRQGLSDKFLSTMFQYNSRVDVSKTITAVREKFMLRCVPENLGFTAITRQQYIEQHVTEFANSLYNPQPDNRVAIFYVDGTYLYTHKSSNFRSLRQSFSRHKGRHLLKPALIVAPDGYILNVHGPYFSDSQNNDAAILQNELDNDEEINNWFQPRDIIVVDRGYRDIIPELEAMGLLCKMPPLLEAGERQLTTEDANESRLVTKTRWIVEARNGHIKTMFKYLGNSQQIHVLPNVGDFYRIAAALINRYRPLIHMQNVNAAFANRMLNRATQNNHVQERVEAEDLEARNIHRWIRLDANHLRDFPLLTMEFLQDLTAGVYQVNLSPCYIQDTCQREDNDEIQVEMLIDEDRLPEPGFLRARIWSRFRNRTRYQLFIEYIPNGNAADEPIRGYYCTCKTGARTLGTCVHIASTIWYLGYAIHEEGNVWYPSQALLECINDAGDRPPQEHLV